MLWPMYSSTQQMRYLVNLLHFSDIRRTLGVRPAVSKQLFVPKIKLSIGKHAFCVGAPTISNQLTIMITFSDSMTTFRKIKSKHLFEIAFPP